MADRIIVKSGTDFTVKSGATISVKSAEPPYIVSGLEQSHWLASDAVVSGGKVLSVPDQSGVASLEPRSGASYYRVDYSAAGWSVGGKTLPTLSLHDGSIYTATAWASKLSGYTGPVTSAVLIQPQFINGGSGNWSRLLDAYADWGLEFPARSYGPVRNKGSYPVIFRSQTDASNAIIAGAGSWLPSNTPQLIVMEYVGATAPTNLGLFRVWVNGVLRVNSTSPDAYDPKDVGNGGRSAINFQEFWAWRTWDNGTLIPQLHIWKGALTDQQRDDITAYLMGVGGLT